MKINQKIMGLYPSQEKLKQTFQVVDELSVDEMSASKCRYLACRPVVGVDELSVDELSVDGLSPHRIGSCVRPYTQILD